MRKPQGLTKPQIAAYWRAASAAAPLLAAAVTVLRNMGIQSVSFFEP